MGEPKNRRTRRVMLIVAGLLAAGSLGYATRHLLTQDQRNDQLRQEQLQLKMDRNAR